MHRWLIHHVLNRAGYNPPTTVFPVSAVMLREMSEYKRVLESYTRRPIEVPEPNLSIAEPVSASVPVITDRLHVNQPRPPPPPVEKAPVSNDYVTRIAAHLVSIKRYPASARRMRREGTVQLERSTSSDACSPGESR